jgi:hypothetical protein
MASGIVNTRGLSGCMGEQRFAKQIVTSQDAWASSNFAKQNCDQPPQFPRAIFAWKHGNCVVCGASPSGCNQGNRGRPINRDCDCRQSRRIQAGCCIAGRTLGAITRFPRNFRGHFLPWQKVSCKQGNRGRPINRDCDCRQSRRIQAGCCIAGRTLEIGRAHV